MAELHTRIEAFFASYESHFNEALAGNDAKLDEAIANSFESCFAGSGPQGVQCGKNDPTFIDAMKKGMEFYKSVGSTSMEIRNNEISILDPFHAMSKISWRYKYIKNDKEGHIDFDGFYFLRITTAAVKIFAFITGDEQAALRQHGLI